MMHSKEYRDDIKRINLAEFAQCFGFALHKGKSSKINPVLKCEQTGAAIVLKLNKSGHYTYFESGTTNRGTIIDFLQWRGVEYHDIPLAVDAYKQGRIKPNNSVKVIEAGASTKPNKTFKIWPYSEAKTGRLELRGISEAILNNPMFQPRIGCDNKGNVCFPLYSIDMPNMICGLQRQHNKRIASGSVRGVWVANPPSLIYPEQPYKILITESVLDNLSYEQLFNSRCYHIATAGTPSAKGLATIKAVVEKVKAPVLLGFDNDEKGDMFADKLEQLLKDIVPTERIRPTLKDWNDDLKAEQTRRFKTI